jgi:hypothetical protein
LIKIENSCKQKKEGNSVVDQVIEISMNKGTSQDANQSVKTAGKDTEIVKINAICDLVYKYKPDEEQKDGWRYQAQDEPFIFNVGFFGQENWYSVFGGR